MRYLTPHAGVRRAFRSASDGGYVTRASSLLRDAHLNSLT